MGIKDIPVIIGRSLFKEDADKPARINKSKDNQPQTVTTSTRPADSVEISDARIAIEKENILASQTSIEDFDHAKNVLNAVLNSIDEKNLLEIHGNADKVKTFLIM